MKATVASSDTGASAAPSVREGGDEPDDDDRGDGEENEEDADGGGERWENEAAEAKALALALALSTAPVSELTRAMRIGESGDRPLRARGSVGGDCESETIEEADACRVCFAAVL